MDLKKMCVSCEKEEAQARGPQGQPLCILCLQHIAACRKCGVQYVRGIGGTRKVGRERLCPTCRWQRDLKRQERAFEAAFYGGLMGEKSPKKDEKTGVQTAIPLDKPLDF